MLREATHKDYKIIAGHLTHLMTLLERECQAGKMHVTPDVATCMGQIAYDVAGLAVDCTMSDRAVRDCGGMRDLTSLGELDEA